MRGIFSLIALSQPVVWWYTRIYQKKISRTYYILLYAYRRRWIRVALKNIAVSSSLLGSAADASLAFSVWNNLLRAQTSITRVIVRCASPNSLNDAAIIMLIMDDTSDNILLFIFFQYIPLDTTARVIGRYRDNHVYGKRDAT